MRSVKIMAVAAIALGFGAGGASATSHGNKYVHSRALGGQVFMMYKTHMSLYIFDGDQSNVSNCYDACAIKWPPALLPAGTKLGENYSLIARKNGAMQAAYKGRPLYFWSNDKKIGDIKGDGIGGVWHLARPDN